MLPLACVSARLLFSPCVCVVARYFLRLCLLMCFTLSFSTFASTSGTAKWQEGEHYKVLNHRHASKRAGVVQLFSYWCVSCYRFEKMTRELQQKLPSRVKFSKVHVNYHDGTTKKLQQIGTKYMLIARAVNKEEAFNSAMFSAIHNQRRTIKNEYDIQAILADQGVSSGKISKLASYAGMKSRISHNNKHFYGKSPVPAFVVNGKYLTKISRRMNQQDLMELIIWLTKQP